MTLNNLGVAQLEQGRLELAVVALESAIRLKPDYGWAYSNLSNASRARGQISAAIAQARRALELQPASAEAQNSLGAAQLLERSLDAAAAAFQQAIALKPAYGAAWVNLGNTRAAQGNLAEALDCYRRAMQIDPHDPLPHSNLVYMLHYDPACDAHGLTTEHQRWQARHAAPLKPPVLEYANARDPDRKLKIGYVSPHFCDHCQAFFLAPLWRIMIANSLKSTAMPRSSARMPSPTSCAAMPMAGIPLPANRTHKSRNRFRPTASTFWSIYRSTWSAIGC